MNRIPTITKNLLIINVIVFMASAVLEMRGIDIAAIGGLHFFMAENYHLYQFVTYMFLHGGFTHILFNMFALWMFGCVIENVWGPKKFLFYYISCGIGAGIIQQIAQFVQFYLNVSAQYPELPFIEVFEIGRQVSSQLNGWTTIGASGAVYAILLAFGMIFPNERIFIFPLPIPIKAKWFVMFYAAVELFSALGSPGDGVAHTAHLGGMLFGFLIIRYWNRHSVTDFNINSGRQFFDNLKHNFERRRSGSRRDEDPTRHETDWEYNERKKANQEEIDRILDKIRKSGYDSLTKEEKRTLFENRN